jgi:hypothetical protein
MVGQSTRVRSRAAIGWCVCAATAALTLTACGESEAKCDYAPTAGDLIGTLTERDGSHAEFMVESIRASSTPRPAGAPALVVGTHVRVHYDGSTSQFLHVGSRYSVTLWWLKAEFWSDIHRADAECSAGTVYADGSSINTSLWARSRVREVVYVFAACVAGLVAVVATRHTRRVQRRRRRARVATGGAP